MMVSPNMDPERTSLPELQIKFIKFVVSPTLQILDSLLRGLRLLLFYIIHVLFFFFFFFIIFFLKYIRV